MERNVQRINGHVEHLHAWSPEELQNALGYAMVRAAGAGQDVQKVVLEMLNRGLEIDFPDQPLRLGEADEQLTETF